MLIVFVSISITSHHAFATSSTGVIVPLYSNPGSLWNQVIQAKNAHPSVPIIAVINPSDGPGPSIDSSYVTGIQQLQSAGIIVLGYVATGYGSHNISSLESQINSYANWYHVNGIMFDEMANTPGFETFYSNLSSYTKSHGMTLTVGNPGTDTLPSYVGTVDNMCIYENPGLPSISVLGGWHTNYQKSNWSMIAFGVGLPSQSYITSVANNVSYVYITNDNLPNPYDTIPSYIGNEVAMLDTGATPPTVPQSPTNLAATAFSSSQINLSWTAPSNNGGSAITGYKIERSSNGGSTWSGLVSNTGSTATTYSDTGLASSTTYTYRVSAINAIGTSSSSNTASATLSTIITVPSTPTGLTATAFSSSQINLSWTAPSNNGGSAITGYKIERSSNGGSTWSGLVSNTGSTATTYSDTGLASSTTYTYRVSAINSVGTSSASNIASATTSTTTNLVKLTVDSVNLSGNPVTGMWTELHASNGTILATGYTPITFNVNSGIQYTVYSADYQSTIFNHWDDGSTSSSKTITPTQSATLTAYYSTGSTKVSITVKSFDSSGNPINGMWTELHSSNGNTIATGFTPFSFMVTPGSQYTIHVENYQNYVFSHWWNGSTDLNRTFTPTKNIVFTAYYNTG